MLQKEFRENAFEQEKKKLGLKFNPVLALIGIQTMGPRLWTVPRKIRTVKSKGDLIDYK